MSLSLVCDVERGTVLPQLEFSLHHARASEDDFDKTVVVRTTQHDRAAAGGNSPALAMATRSQRPLHIPLCLVECHEKHSSLVSTLATMAHLVTLEEIQEARLHLERDPLVLRTPLLASAHLKCPHRLPEGLRVDLKLEGLQMTGGEEGRGRTYRTYRPGPDAHGRVHETLTFR